MKTQSYNDGVVVVYSVENIAEPGSMPVDKITQKESLRYDDALSGLNRFYAPYKTTSTSSMCSVSASDPYQRNVAIPNDGKQYKIVQIQYRRTSNRPAWT